MKLTAYAELLVMGKEALDKALAPKRARAVRKQGELEAAKLDERIATLENEVNELASKKEVHFESIINKLDELALAERKKKQFNDILEQMFPNAEENK